MPASPDNHPPQWPDRSRRAIDPFFLFTCTLLALAAIAQVVLILWMDFF